jgi:hypothetical protein
VLTHQLSKWKLPLGKFLVGSLNSPLRISQWGVYNPQKEIHLIISNWGVYTPELRISHWENILPNWKFLVGSLNFPFIIS